MLLRFALLTLLLAACLVTSACLGEVNFSPARLVEILSGPDSGGLATMFLEIRLPRLLAAALVGAALSVSGYLLQLLSRNYLADPYLTGVSSGAGLAVAIAMALSINSVALPLLALAGGLGTALLVAYLSRTTGGISVTRLLLSGVALSAACSSLITLLVVTAGSHSAFKAQGLYFWLAGSLSGCTWGDLAPTSVYVLLAEAAALALSKPLRLLSLGSESAASLGLNVPVAQWSVLICAVTLCAGAVSLSGIVGFVGLVAPYISRRLFGQDQRLHLVASAAAGSTLVVVADLVARMSVPGQELPLGTLLSLVGAPFFLLLVLRHQAQGGTATQ